MSLLLCIQSALLIFTTALIIHFLICRFFGNKNFILCGIILGVIGIVTLLTYQIIMRQLDIISVYLFFAAWLIYLIIFINLLNSVTLKMLAYLNASQEHSLPSKAFSTAFNIDDGLHTRFHMMQLNGLVRKHGNVIYLTFKANIFLKIINTIGQVFSLRIG
jgi:hypothetical protein